MSTLGDAASHLRSCRGGHRPKLAPRGILVSQLVPSCGAPHLAQVMLRRDTKSSGVQHTAAPQRHGHSTTRRTSGPDTRGA
ncbi:hypothetical protein E2C01_067715 [Portunus trituberculatus]|uniref:Uncharacterized protein n=1 Tax=Portunus trituberculatus TaxID=210409 RepID=A0A5B7HXG9_PORTR|nr:hypothetical protein [Portunus trituberculatus]